MEWEGFWEKLQAKEFDAAEEDFISFSWRLNLQYWLEQIRLKAPGPKVLEYWCGSANFSI